MTALRTVLRGGTVFNGSSEPASADVLIEGNRILDVGPGLEGDEEVDVTGRTVLPGIVDCHVHVVVDGIDAMRRLQMPFSYRYYRVARNLEAILRCGVTTVRDASGADLGIKQACEDGLVDGPRMQIAIAMLTQTGGHSDNWLPSGCFAQTSSAWLLLGSPVHVDPIVDGPEQMRKRVRELVRAGADWIKVASSGGVMSPRDDPRHAHLRDEELQMAVREATSAGIEVMAHAIATDGVRNAVRNGIRSVEHGIYLDDEVVGMMLDAGTYLVPTLSAPQSVIDAAESGAGITDASLRKAREVIDAHAASFRRAVDAGVKIAMGTDAVGWPHGRNLEELERMAALGMPPLEVLRSSTSAAADLLRIHDVGRVEPGRCADLVIVDGDALQIAGISKRVRAVYKDGVLV